MRKCEIGKSFIILTPDVDVKKLFSSSLMTRLNKLEWFVCGKPFHSGQIYVSEAEAEAYPSEALPG
jgi:hypothetical protein